MLTRVAAAMMALGVGLPLVSNAASIQDKETSALREAEVSHGRKVVPVLTRYCYPCHGQGKSKGEVRLDAWPNTTSMVADRALWQRVARVLQNHEMPPSNKPQPGHHEVEAVMAWIDRAVFDCDCRKPDPGRVTLRRLNRAEYNLTIRDLLGVDFKPADDFPVDDSGYGFDNIGDALSLPPMLLEKYLAASERIVDAALGFARPTTAETRRYSVDALEVGYNAKQRGDGWVALTSIEEDDVAVEFTAPAAGDYVLRAHAWARQETARPMSLTFMRGDRPVEDVTVETNQAAPRVYEARLPLPAGRHRLRAVVRRIKDGLAEADALQWKKGPQQKGAVLVEWIEVAGPFGESSTAIARGPARDKILFIRPKPGREAAATRSILERFGRRAWRRPIQKGELDRLVALSESARARHAEHAADNDGAGPVLSSFEEGVRVALQAMLVSPHFLFRGELQPEPDNPKPVHPINEYALASRLSYFLWSTMPDEKLFNLARRGQLRLNLERQVRRMLQDPKACALTANFAGQWLQTRNLDYVSPDEDTFPDFDESLRAAMKGETERLFEHVLRGDRSIHEFLDADYTFVNERLAKHYGLPFDAASGSAGKGESGGIGARSAGRSGKPGNRSWEDVTFSGKPGVGGETWVLANLEGTPRRGVLTHAGILTLTSNPTRTSPVKRGKWVLETLLNAPPPPPPPNVPELKVGKELQGTLRERMVQHRADPLCASCHERMDAIGFGLENFDGIGAWRTNEGPATIDASGDLGLAGSFEGPLELTGLLARNRRDAFARCFVEKMLTYALGRGLEPHDKCAVESVLKRAANRDYRFSEVVLGIVQSVPFQKRRGESVVSNR